MDTKALRQKVLDLAIHGKLVPQDSNDEPASELLKRIRAEKEALVKAGKLKKKDLTTTPITDDEKPFDIPESWEWCRLGEVGIFERGSGIKRDETFDKGMPCVRYGEMYTKYRYAPTFDKTVSFTSQTVFDKCRKAKQGDLFMALTGENKQDIALAAQYIGKEDVAVGGDLCHFAILEAFALYFVYLINSPFYTSKKELLATGDIIVHISADKLGSIAIPLPPLAEQKRIVAKVEKWFALIDVIESNQQDLNTAIDQAKAKILDLAIHGKLVPQDENGEPASELLKRIRAEKEALVKAKKIKKIKKGKPSEPITEAPFEVPEGWEWVSVKDVCTKVVDGDHNPPKGEDTPTKYYMLSSKNINSNTIVDKEDCRYLSHENWVQCHNRTNLKKGDILLTTVATLGRSCVCEEDVPYCFQRSVTIFTALIYNYYLKYVFDSPYYQRLMEDNAKGTAQKGFYLNQVEASIIPLPPLAEQKRIVEKVEQLFAQLDKIKEAI